MADRKRKGKAVSSSSQVPKFKAPYHEAHYKAKLSARKVLPELIIQVDESILDPCGFQIQQRKWERFTNPIQVVGHLMVKEFYANAWEPDKEKRKPYTYTTMPPFPSIIAALYADAKVLAIKDDTLIPQEPPIMGVAMIRVRQFKEMEMQGIPVTMANLAIHRQKEEEMNQERMRYDQILQEAATQQAREANKGKAREVVPDSEEEEDSKELASSASEEW
ncbi:hypothetical protein PIB30_014250 [Stylosanthes scabra]|uniref:Uncharacterized protein n=1 Tax=Stylosanthes scabra TaxID=79078 RepID=A0ABU6Y592_9FABA|nr:hypothetical protein [Stylosanthes scabra]